MKIFLAPMEGVVDYSMRALLTEMGGYTHCVTEFIRVTGSRLPQRVFYRYCPELQQQAKTAAGVPVIVQLLGSDPFYMAENARRAVRLGAPGIDLNFGCPSPTVNRHSGGAALLRQPELIEQLVAAVRNTLPDHIPLSAKIRLGYQDTTLALENAKAVEQGGADYIVVHARTKVDGYKHPARWEWLAQIKQQLNIPVVANGDINSVDDFLRCRQISGCQHIMLGRGALASPSLALQITQMVQGKSITPMSWESSLLALIQLAETLLPDDERGNYMSSRIKQWLKYLRLHYSQAECLWQQVKRIKQNEQMLEYLYLQLNRVS